jgi:flagellar biosynthesis component FlhA
MTCNRCGREMAANNCACSTTWTVTLWDGLIAQLAALAAALLATGADHA